MVFTHRNRSEKPDAGTYFLCMIVGLFLGFVFLQMPGNNTVIHRADATKLVGTLQDCTVHYQKGHLHTITLSFSDIDKQFIHDVCTTNTLADALTALPVGTDMTLLVHPRSHNVLEIRVGEETLLEFDRSQELLSNNAGGFGILGFVMITIGILCGIRFVRLEIKLYRK